LTEASQRLAQGDYSDDVQVVALGEVGELARTFRDMTDRIRTRERELREHLARLNTILINAADGIITFDQTGRIEHANAAAEEMFGTGPGGLIGTKVQKLMKLPQHLQAGVILKPSSTGSGGAAAQHGGTVTQLCNAVKTPGEEHRGLRQDGSTFWMEVTFSQVPLEDRRIITGIFRNVTQRKLAEERIRHLNDELDARVRLRTAQLEDAKSKLELALSQAESASAAKDRFISVVSHELRTPLTSAMGYTELLLNPRATKLRENPGPTLDKILTSCKHLLTLINDLLDVGRYTAGKPIDLAPTRFDLTSFLRGVQEMVTPLVKKNGNVLETIVPAGLGEIHNDETRLRQVLLNLLSNASKFTEKGRVCLQVERQRQETGDTLVFRVSDTGAGMTTEQVEKLFTPFYRVDNSMTRRQGGTGLGLTITKMICELMGGKIEVESVLGQGSTFTVTLPAEIGTAGRKPGGQPGSAETSAESRGTVLVIDDDVTVRHMLETYLQQEGYRVIQAATGTAGLQLAREHQPMCITLDVLMPGEDGWDVLARLKNDPATRDIPVIMLTIMEERNRGFALGATEYVTKPIDWGRLGSILCRYNPQQAPILIVEDDALQRGYLREELILAGWTVLEAANGAEALKVCETTTPSLILLDLTMPIMDGFTFLDELHRKEGGADIPVVVVTARELSDEDRRRLNRSVAQVLAKESLSKEKLLERIQAQMHAAAKVGS
jgi:signal transduction histidine kinase/DNA-binding response OmpR family regulator